MLDETHWHRINAKVASHVFSLLASVEGTTVCLEIPLQSRPPPPPGHRHLVTVSPPHPGDRRALPRDFARGGRVPGGNGSESRLTATLLWESRMPALLLSSGAEWIPFLNTPI